MKYRKKPVVVEAFHHTKEKSVKDFCDFIKDDSLWYRDSNNNLIIKTLEGDMVASEGDYIIKGVQGEFYPCKPDIFEQTYTSEIRSLAVEIKVTETATCSAVIEALCHFLKDCTYGDELELREIFDKHELNFESFRRGYREG